LDLQEIVLKAPIILGLIGSLFFIFNYKYFSTIGIIIGWFVVFTLSCESLGSYYAELKKNNLFIVHAYTLGTFVFFSLFFQRLFRSLKWDNIKNWHISLGIILIILNSIFIEKITTYNAYSKTAVQVFIILMCILAYSLMTTKKYPLNDQFSVKMFIAAILLNCSLTTMLYLFSNQIMAMDQSTQETIWLINVGANIVVQILYLIGFIKTVQLNKIRIIG